MLFRSPKRIRRRADAPRAFPDGFRRDRGSGAFRFPAGAADSPVRRITTGWEHYRGQLGGVWEVWRGKAASDNVTWDAVAIPHCFNAWDAVDPDHAYYQGPGWYRTSFAARNPFPNGRTLLHFEGAGQKSEVFVGLESVGQHVGDYDEFTLDITLAAARAARRPDAKGQVQELLAIKG